MALRASIAGMAWGIVAVAVGLMAASGPVRAAAYEAIALDAETGQVLRVANPDVMTYPASLTKMMTLYLTFEALNNGRLRLDHQLPVSR